MYAYCLHVFSVCTQAWVYLGTSAARHDAAHLVSWHGSTTALPALASALPTQWPTAYAQLLTSLSRVAATEIDHFLTNHSQLSEPAIARHLSRLLPDGHAMFLGNSMPIRDMDMYAGSRPGSAAVMRTPTAANRGASGIDGVLSSAAGFAEGLNRPTTLVVGDLSFLHDINGLNMLRTTEARPPLTVVLVNNNGGGIFSFLPIAAAVPDPQFTSLWATPQNVDLEGMCRAHGIPHQRVVTPEQFATALQSAWGLNRHSVVEAVTTRDSNVALHRQLQSGVQRAVQQAAQWLPPQKMDSSCITLTDLSWSAYSLPLQRSLTSAAGVAVRTGLLVRVSLQASTACTGVGEAAPLPGLHAETVAQCEGQLYLLRPHLLAAQLPPTLALLSGNISDWWRSLGLEPDHLYPSVR